VHPILEAAALRVAAAWPRGTPPGSRSNDDSPALRARLPPAELVAALGRSAPAVRQDARIRTARRSAKYAGNNW